MYCTKCGKEIPENSRFCGGCGTPVGNQSPISTEPKKSKKVGNKNRSIMISLAVILAAFLFGKFVIAPSMLTESPDNGSTRYQSDENGSYDETEIPTEPTSASEVPTETVGTSEVVSNSSYSDIFSSRNLVVAPTLFFTPDSAAFAFVNDAGIIDQMEFGYRDDVVIEMANTAYYPTADMDEEQKAELEATVKANLAQLEAEDFCTVTYYEYNSFYSVTIHYKGMDDPEIIRTMAEYGLIANAAADYVSMADTEKSLLSNGYLKKYTD